MRFDGVNRLLSVKSRPQKASPEALTGLAKRGSRFGPSQICALVLVVVALVTFLGPLNPLFNYEVVVAYTVAALGIFLTIRVAGEFMVGHVAIVGLAAYTVGWLNVHTSYNPLEILPFALVAGAVTALALGLPGIRLGALYLGVISLLPVFILPQLSEAFSSVSGGESGLLMKPFNITTNPRALYAAALIVLLLCAIYTTNIIRSTWGVRFMALRDAPQSLQASGISLASTKACVYVLSSVPASFGGWLLAYINGIVIAGFYGLALSLLLVAAVIIAGSRSVVGLLFSAAILAGYTQLVGPFSPYNQLGLGILLLVFIVLLPSGFDSLSGVSLNQLRLLRLRIGGRSEFDAGQGPSEKLSSLEVAPQDRAGGSLSKSQPVAPEDGEATRILSVENVSVAFGGNVALQDVKFEMRAGRILGLVGANGSGKTTLINVMTGFIRPQSGIVAFKGQSIAGRPPHRISRCGIGRTFQVPRLIDDLTLRRNLELGLLASNSDSLFKAIFTGGRIGGQREKREETVDHVAELIGIEVSRLSELAGSLSLGMKRIVEVGRAIAGSAALICLDEPAAGLNEPEIERLSETLRAVAASGCAVMLVEHHMNFVLSLCDDILVLERGRVAGYMENRSGMRLPEALTRHIGVSQ
jgi:branched-chain amino acid transport system permease protein